MPYRDKRFQSLVQQSSDIICLLDRQLRVIYGSPSYWKLVGLEPASVKNEKFTALVHPEDRSKFGKGIRRLTVESQGSQRVAFRMRNSMGAWRDFEGTARNLLADPELNGFVLNFCDVTAEKKALQRDLFMARMSVLLVSSLDCRKTLSNIARLIVPRMADWFGVDLLYPDGNLKLVEIFHKDPEKRAWAKKLRSIVPVNPSSGEPVDDLIRAGRAIFCPVLPKDLSHCNQLTAGQKREVKKMGIQSAMIVPLVAKEEVLGAISFAISDSDRRYGREDLRLAEEIGRFTGLAISNARSFESAQKEIQQNRELLRKLANLADIVRSSDDAIIGMDLGCNITSWNRGAEKIFGFTNDEATGKGGQSLFAGDCLPEFKTIIANIKRGVVLERFDTVGVRKNGFKVHLSVSVSPIRNASGRCEGFSAIMRDINERVELERRKDDFISIASHELKTPITALKGYAQILVQGVGSDEKTRLYVSKMNKQINRLTELVNDLLDVSRIQSGRLELNRQSFDIDKLVCEVTEEIQKLSTRHKIEVITRVRRPVYADRLRLREVLINLLSNAVKYSPRADRIIVRTAVREDGILISVQDFGIGISQNDTTKIFGRFYQARNKIRTSFAGLGLGLFVSAETIKSHGGKIWVDSIKGNGSTFYFIIPNIAKASSVEKAVGFGSQAGNSEPVYLSPESGKYGKRI